MADAARALLPRTHLATVAATSKAGSKLGPPGSQPLMIVGPGRYDPQPMQRDMMPTQFELYPQRRMELDTRTHEAAAYYAAAGAKTEAQWIAGRAEYVAYMSNKPKQFVTSALEGSRWPAPPHLHPYRNTPHPFKQVDIDTLRRSGGAGSAIYPTAPAATRPQWPGINPIVTAAERKVNQINPLGATYATTNVGPHLMTTVAERRPFTSPGALLASSPSSVSFKRSLPDGIETLRSNLAVGTDALNRGTRLLAAVHASARSGEPMPIVPVVPHERRMGSAQRGLSIAAIKAIRRFYASHGGGIRTVAEMTSPGSGSEGVCSLNQSTGLSLVETLALAAAAPTGGTGSTGSLGRFGNSVKGGCLSLSAGYSGVAFEVKRCSGAAGLLGPATTFVRCPNPESTSLLALLDAIIETSELLDRDFEAREDDAMLMGAAVAAAPGSRYVWLEAFAVSQPLVHGLFSPQLCDPGSVERAAREEHPIQLLVEEALEEVVELFVFTAEGKPCRASPLRPELTGAQRYLMMMREPTKITPRERAY